ncbi:MAG TPA: imidazolonepropionase [Bryobacteraceae bacterium]|nr:imidazolonepropionase [Bryobacteraceae bacterium]
MRTLVTNCSQLVTLAGPPGPRIRGAVRDLAIIPDGAMLIDDGRITHTGARAELEPTITPDDSVIDARRRLVMPGFVDAHTHPVFAGNRAAEFEQRCAGATYAEIAAAGGGIRSTVRATRAASEDQLLADAQRYISWFHAAGTTTIEAKSGYGLTLDDERKLLHVIARLENIRAVPTFLGAHEIPDEYRDRPSAYADLVIREMLPAVADSPKPIARFCDVFCEPGIFSIEESRRILTAAHSLGLGIRIHADQLSDSGGAALAAELGAATADHLEHTSTRGILALASAGVQPVLLPASVYALGSSRYPDARAMIDAGLAVVLATDFNPGSSPTPSMPMILSLACTQMKITPAEALIAATINAAHSLGLGREIGSLEPGKRADFAIYDLDDYREIAYFFGVPAAAAVYLDGRPVWERSSAGVAGR